MTTGDILTLVIEKAVAGGRMLARHDRAIVLVSGALPGETVEARVERVQKGTAWAEVVAVVDPSPHRVGEPNPCGGCLLAHASYDHQLAIKQAIVVDAFTRVARMAVPAPEVVPSPTDGYRMRARLHAGGGRVGFYREGTHDICDPSSTRQLLVSTLDVLDQVAAHLARTPDAVAAIDLAENREASERALHFDLAHEADPSGLGVLAAIPGVTSLSYSHAASPRVRLLAGEGRVTDHFSSGDTAWSLSRGTRTFFQGNRFLIEPLIEEVTSRMLPGPLTDLYAGVGVFALAAAVAGRAPVTAVEGDAAAAADLRDNLAGWRGIVQTRHEAVEAFVARRRFVAPQTVIVDPPRTGLSKAALAGVAAMKAPRVVYVSCDMPTLARDARALTDAGYALAALRAFDLFPGTAHLETVAVFDLAG